MLSIHLVNNNNAVIIIYIIKSDACSRMYMFWKRFNAECRCCHISSSGGKQFDDVHILYMYMYVYTLYMHLDTNRQLTRRGKQLKVNFFLSLYMYMYMARHLISVDV